MTASEIISNDKNMMLLTELESQHVLMPYFTEDRPKYEHSSFALICFSSGFKSLNLMTMPP